MGIVVDLLAGQLAAAGQTQGCHTTIGILGRAGKNLELNLLHQIGDIDQLQRDTQIGAVDTAYRLGITHAWKFLRQRNLQRLRKQLADHLFHQHHDLVFIQKRGLDIELGKLGLPVGTQVFITEAAYDLVITIHAGHHQ